MKRKITTSPTNPMIKHINGLLNKAQTAFFATLMLLLFNTQQALAQITISEDFDYGASAGNLAGQTGGSGFAAAWAGGTGGYIATGLTFGALSSLGGAQSGSGFVRQITTGFAASGPVSGSFLFQMTSASNSVEMLGLGTNASWNNQNHYIGLMPANDGQAGKPALGIRGTGISAMTGGASLTQGTTYMYAFSYDNGSTSAWILSLSQYNNFFNGTTLDQTAMNAASIGTGSTNVTGKVTLSTSSSSLATMNYIYTYWFGGGSMTIDRIRMSGTAALSGLGSAVAGAALNFDGVDDYVDVPDANVLDLGASLTLEAWVRPTSFSTYNMIIDKRLNTDAAANYGLTLTNGKPMFYFWPNTSDLHLHIATNAISLNTWSHIAATYDGAMVRIFVNGTQVYAQAETATPPTTNQSLNIGRNPISLQYFSGEIDEVRIWNTARTCDQIRQLRNCELAGNESGLVAYYKFNQGTAAGDNTALPTLTDATANGNNGTFNSFTLNGSSSNFIATGGVTTGVSCGAVLAPEINLKGNTVSIPSGTTATATSNHTDFGTVASGGSFARTFTIENTGTATLTISNITSNNAKFVVSNIPPSVSASGSQTFTVTFNPTATGAQTATITVSNDDCDEGTYTFAVTGTGTAPVYTFNGTTNSDWATASNWSTGAVPTSLSSGDAVVIGANCTMTNVAALSFPSGTSLTVNASTTLSVNGTSAITTQSGATLTNNGTMTVNSTFTNNGTYKGTGTYTGSLFTNPSGSFVNVGNSAGCMTFSNGFTNNGTIQIEVGGITACTQSDKITVTGTATLGGTLSLTYINGYTGSGNQTVNIIDATALSGTFATVSGLLSNWFNNYNAPATGKVTLSYSSVLSVELLNFKATPSVSSVKLDWETANEVNNKGFQIERLQSTVNSQRSTDGKWDILGFVNAKSKEATYEFLDVAPPSGAVYYRLRQIDNDGKETLSKVVSASLKSKGGLSIYPNPVSSLLTLSVIARNEATEGSDYQILNLLGQQVLSGKTTPQIDVSVLPQGTYVIKVGAEQAKFVKK